MEPTKDRREHRLELARKLLRLDKNVNVRDYINNLTSTQKDRLRELVDWVEEYEKHETT